MSSSAASWTGAALIAAGAVGVAAIALAATKLTKSNETTAQGSVESTQRSTVLRASPSAPSGQSILSPSGVGTMAGTTDTSPRSRQETHSVPRHGPGARGGGTPRVPEGSSSGTEAAHALSPAPAAGGAPKAAGSAPAATPPPAVGGRSLMRQPSFSKTGPGEAPWLSGGDTDKVFVFDGAVREVSNLAITTMALLEVPNLHVLHPEGNANCANVRRDLSQAQANTAAHSAASASGSADGAADSDDDEDEEAEGLGADGSPKSSSYFNLVDENAIIVGDIVRKAGHRPVSRAYVRAGPRARTYFKPTTVRAAIVTCGGLCPGLNNVIRELVETLIVTYGAEKVYGVRNGYWGFHTADANPAVHADPSHPHYLNVPKEEPWLLTPQSVASIQNLGGTILGTDRGGNDTEVVLRFCMNRKINQLYVIGGDGTHRGAHAIHLAALAKKFPLAVAAIPKTIDNDVDLIDRSFGFDTAVSEAQRAIQTAKVEASAAVNGVGLVKLMGRFAGYIAAHATMASGDVDLCLIPEVPLITEGPASFLAHIERVIRLQGHAVVVVAEGAGEEMLAAETGGGTDAGGNKKLPPIGPWLTKRITDHLSKVGLKPTLKYIDPSYMIRSVPANAADSIYCTLLAQASVHGSMAGYTGFSTGLVNNRLVYLPITTLTANSPRRMNPRGRTYERILQLTRQPDPFSYAKFYGLTVEKKKEGPQA